jgi:hypothetical protein
VIVAKAQENLDVESGFSGEGKKGDPPDSCVFLTCPIPLDLKQKIAEEGG